MDKYESYPDVMEDIDSQVRYENQKYKERAKTKLRIANDVKFWHFVQGQRDVQNINLPLQAKYWIVTVDFRFLNFDKYKISQAEIPAFRIPVCMLPAQFIQTLRFFAPRSSQFEKIMLGAMRFPLVSREFDTKAEQITVRILGQLARFEGIGDLSPETIQRILTDDALRARLTGDSKATREAVKETLESVVTKQIENHQQLAKEKEAEITTLKGNLQNLISTYEKERKETENLRQEMAKIRSAIDHKEQMIARTKSIRNYVLLSIALFVPYPILLAIAWKYLISNIQVTWLAYGITITLTVGISVLIMRVLLTQGKKDDQIAKLPIFATVAEKMSLKALVTFILTLLDIGKSIRYNGISRAESRRAETWSQPRQHRMRIASRVRRC